MRHYSNELSDFHGQVTGFQSACSEFAEKALSLDERLNIGNPAIISVRAAIDDSVCDIRRGDLLIVDLSKRPKLNDLIVVNDRIVKLKCISDYAGVEIHGVVIGQFRDYVSF